MVLEQGRPFDDRRAGWAAYVVTEVGGAGHAALPPVRRNSRISGSVIPMCLRCDTTPTSWRALSRRALRALRCSAVIRPGFGTTTCRRLATEKAPFGAIV